MVIKILSGGGSFHGIDYNEKKVEKGVAERMVTNNFFDFSEYNASNLKEELQTHSKLSNGRKDFKNKQFHVALSTEGKTLNKDELLKIGNDYMEYMGYQNNPYAMYFHNDTSNNHIHIVSSRVDENGKRIESSFERLKTQKFLKEHLGIDYSLKNNEHIERINSMNFSTIGQVHSLGKSMNLDIKMESESDVFKVYSQGKALDDILLNELNIDKDLKKKNIKRVNQIKAVLHKYNKEVPFENMKDFLHSKFGLELLFNETRNYSFELNDDKIILQNYDEKGKSIFIPDEFRNEVAILKTSKNIYELRDNSSPDLKLFMQSAISQLNPKLTGYSIVDNKFSNVFKGSDILKLNQLQNATINDPFNKTIIDHIQDKGLVELKRYVQLHGGHLNKDLDIAYKDDVIRIDKLKKVELIKRAISEEQKGYTIIDDDLTKQLDLIFKDSDLDLNSFLNDNNLIIEKSINGNLILINEDQKTISPIDDNLTSLKERNNPVFENDSSMETKLDLSYLHGLLYFQDEDENGLSQSAKKKKKKKNIRL